MPRSVQQILDAISESPTRYTAQIFYPTPFVILSAATLFVATGTITTPIPLMLALGGVTLGYLAGAFTTAAVVNICRQPSNQATEPDLEADEEEHQTQPVAPSPDAAAEVRQESAASYRPLFQPEGPREPDSDIEMPDRLVAAPQA